MADGVMADPAPENIDGRKIVSHSFEHQMVHQVNWSHVALAVLGLVVIYVLLGRRGDGDLEDDGTEQTEFDLGNSVGW
jgi:hypothetical protein